MGGSPTLVEQKKKVHSLVIPTLPYRSGALALSNRLIRQQLLLGKAL
jgi:hypothetical protein